MNENNYINKVVFGSETFIDLTKDTVSAENLISGYSAHNAAGEPIVGSVVVPTKISDLEDDIGVLDLRNNFDDIQKGRLPVGVIVIWSGYIADIPEGWQLCDGTNGTPDLRGRFIIGANDSLYPVNRTGGETDHALTVDEMPTHSHVSRIFNQNNKNYDAAIYPAGYLSQSTLVWSNNAFKTAGVNSDGQGVGDPSGITSETGSGKTHNNMPPYYALCYIIKMSNNNTLEPNYTTESKVNEIFDEKSLALLNIIYPIGSIWISFVPANPKDLFGLGEWEQIKDTFLLSAGDIYNAGDIGGESEHVLIIDEIPSHSHKIPGDVHNNVEVPNKQSYYGTLTSDGNKIFYQNDDNYETLKSGGSQPHNNMPPYLVVYIWKRIS